MKLIKTTEAVGHILCHDMTQIIPGVKKDAVFRKGHIVEKKDIPVLLSMGKENLYVWEKTEGMLHENEAAEILYNMCKNNDIVPSDIKEGKIDLIASQNGVLKVNVDILEKINSLGQIIIATRHSNFPVKKGDKLAGTRVIPLVIEKEKMDEAVAIADGEPILKLCTYIRKKVGIITTGSEVFHGRIKDAFGPVIMEKLKEYDIEFLGQKILDDHPKQIGQAIQDFITQGAELVICTGGMSVDPDDTTPTAIKSVSAELISYGAPVLPGAMFLLAYSENNIPIVGLPGCVMYAKRTIFDLVLPRIMTGEKLCKDDLSKLGHGGLCLSCSVCTFPNCSFGK